MTENQIELGRHALGLPNKHRRSFRNHFCARPGHTDYQAWAAMVGQGDALHRDGSPISGGDDVFWLTMIGATACLKLKEKLDPDAKWPRPGHTDYQAWAAMVGQGDALHRDGSPISGGDDVFWLTMIGATACLKLKEKLDPDAKWPRG